MCWKKCVEKFQISWLKTRWQCFISTLVGGHKYPYDHILILVQHGEPEDEQEGEDEVLVQHGKPEEEDEQEGEDEVVDVGVWHLSLSLTGVHCAIIRSESLLCSNFLGYELFQVEI